MSGVRPVYSGLYILFVVEDQIILFVCSSITNGYFYKLQNYVLASYSCKTCYKNFNGYSWFLIYFDEKQTVHGQHWSTDHILSTSIEETWGRVFLPGQNFDVWKTRLTLWCFSFWTFCSLLLTFLFLKPRRSLCPLNSR